MSPVFATSSIGGRYLRQVMDVAPEFMAVGHRPSAMNRIWPTNERDAFSNG